MYKDKRYSLLFYIALCFAIALGTNCFAQNITTSDKRVEIPLPLDNKSEQILYRKGYTVSYNKNYKIPNWVAWHLTADHSSGTCLRPTNAWHEDEDVAVPRATIADYKGSGWSRGHMCPAGEL